MPDVTLDLAADLPPRLRCLAQPVALRRAIANLIENAVKYGSGARVSLARRAGRDPHRRRRRRTRHPD